MEFAFCPILDDDVIVFIDLEGNTKNVGRNRAPAGPCPELNAENWRCGKKERNLKSAPIMDGVLVKVANPRILDGVSCVFFDPTIFPSTQGS